MKLYQTSKDDAKKHVNLIKENPDLISTSDGADLYVTEYLQNIGRKKGREIIDTLSKQGTITIFNKKIISIIKNLKKEKSYILSDDHTMENIRLLEEYFPEKMKRIHGFLTFCYLKNKAMLGLLHEEPLPNPRNLARNSKIGPLLYRDTFSGKFGDLYIRNINDINIVKGANIKFVIYVQPQKTGTIKTPRIQVLVLQEDNSESKKISYTELKNKDDYVRIEEFIKQLKEKSDSIS